MVGINVRTIVVKIGNIRIANYFLHIFCGVKFFVWDISVWCAKLALLTYANSDNLQAIAMKRGPMVA